jgi:excisionase family DNA binding protein
LLNLTNPIEEEEENLMIDINYQEKLLTTKEVAGLLSVRPNTVRSCAKKGIIPSMKLKRKFLFRREDVAAFIKEFLFDPRLNQAHGGN